MPPKNLTEEFANTFKEWHYLLGGFFIGFFIGLEYYRRILQ